MEREVLKRRIVGVVVLLALVVIVLPFLLDVGGQRGNSRKEPSVPPRPEGGLVTKVVPLQKWADQTQQQVESARGPQNGGGQAPLPEMPLAEPPSAVVKPPAAQPSAPSEPQATAWVVQLGSFSSEKNADALRDRLRKKGYAAFVERAAADEGGVLRVRVGPELRRSRAEALRDELARETGLKAIVLEYH